MIVVVDATVYKDAGTYTSRRCPLQVALQRMFPQRNVSVGGTYCRIGETEYQIKDPTYVTKMVDARLPFTAELI